MTTQPTKVIDKNGKPTTVHKNIDKATGSKPARSIPAPPAPKPSGDTSMPNYEYPFDINEYEDICTSILANNPENSLSIPRTIPVIQAEVAKRMTSGDNFADAWEKTKQHLTPVWIDGYAQAIKAIEDEAMVRQRGY